MLVSIHHVYDISDIDMIWTVDINIDMAILDDVLSITGEYDIDGIVIILNQYRQLIPPML